MRHAHENVCAATGLEAASAKPVMWEHISESNAPALGDQFHAEKIVRNGETPAKVPLPDFHNLKSSKPGKKRPVFSGTRNKRPVSWVPFWMVYVAYTLGLFHAIVVTWWAR